MAENSDEKQSRRFSNTQIIVAVIGAFGIIIAAIIAIIPILIDQPTPEITSQYSFETGTQGWNCQTDASTPGCVKAEQSSTQAKEGAYSLQVTMDLKSGDPNSPENKGEVWISWSGEVLDLSNQTITVWVYTPKGSRGEKNAPNGFQVFVKDANSFKSLYGCWHNVAVEDDWFAVRLPVSESAPECPENIVAYMDSGFDPSKIVGIGIKMGIGEGSKAIYQDVIYVDAVDWQPTTSSAE